MAGHQRAGLDRLDEPEDAEIDALHRARQDVRAEVRLVDVDAVAPDTGLLRRRKRAEAARACDREDDLRTGRDLVLRDRLALVLRDEVLRVADQDLRPGDALPSAGPVAGDERVDRRDLHAARRADRVAARALRHQRGEAADQVALLLGLERDPGDVLDDQLPVLVRERRDLDRVVRDRELGVRELLRDRRLRVCEQEARRDDCVIPEPRDRREVRDVVACGVRLDRPGLHVQLRLGHLQPGQLVLVEALVVEPADVADQGCLEGRPVRSAAHPGQQQCDKRDHRHGKRNRHESSLTHVVPPSCGYPLVVGAA